MNEVIPYNWKTLAALWIRNDVWCTNGEGDGYYRDKWAIADRLQPASICEIGTRAGYSALCFLWACPRARYLGIDIDEERMRHARGLMAQYDAIFRKEDSQKLRTTDIDGEWDFWHVDGDHTYKSASHDLVLAEANGARWILLDDCGWIPEVKKAGDEFAERDGWGVETVAGGNLLLIREGVDL